MCTSGMLRSSPRIITLLKYFYQLNPLKKKEFKVRILPKPEGTLAHLMPSSATEAAISNETKRCLVGGYGFENGCLIQL